MCAIDITAEQRKTVLALLARHLPNTTAWVYGSRVKWTARPQSDLDLVVIATPEQAGRVSDLREAFEESNLPFRVDLFVWDEVPEQFRKQIEAEHVVLVEKEERRVGGECREYDVNVLIDNDVLVVGDGYRAKNTELSNTGIPFARVGNIRDGFQFSDADCFPDDDLHKVDEKISRPGDVVFTSKGTVGRFAFVRNDTPRFVYSPQLCFWRSLDPEKLAPRFLYYWMTTREFSTQFKSVAGQTDMAEYVSLGDQRRMHITLPPFSEQRAIAHILGTLDDKIELNRTLEAMARALFTSWFVDFDPVRAKMEGRDRGLPKGIAALFPDRLVDSELGEIPEGWEISEMGEEVDAVGGATPRTKDPAYWNEGQHHWATPKDLSKLLSPVLLGTDRKITDAGVQKISSGLLPPGTVLLSSRAPIGYLAIAEVPTAVNQGFIAMVCRRQLPNLYVLSWCYENLEHIKDISGGSTFAEINKKAFRPLPVVVPSKRVLGVYEDESRSLYDRVVSNTRESALLVSLRDTLLPKLVSGELRAKQIEPESSISNISPDTTGVQA